LGKDFISLIDTEIELPPPAPPIKSELVLVNTEENILKVTTLCTVMAWSDDKHS
jgi:hypothetical protein